jgi:hypothetical protein
MDLDIVYCNGGAPIAFNEEEQKKFDAWTSELNQSWADEARQEAEVVYRYAQEKPAWFRSAERSARNFVQGLGLTAAKGTRIILTDIPGGELNQRVFNTDDEEKNLSADALYNQRIGIIVKAERAAAAYDMWGKIAIGKLLVHELTHSAEQHGPVHYSWNGEGWDMDFRQGLMTGDGTTMFGNFFIEAIPEFNAGLYVRRQLDPSCPLAPDTHLPAGSLPYHFTAYNPPKAQRRLAGPEGYAIELLAKAADRPGMVGAGTFLRSAFDTYSTHAPTRLAGLRAFARNIDSVEPGLYPRLRALTYGYDQFREGLQMVDSAVHADDTAERAA